MERDPNCVCPFCGCLYDHDELVAIYAEALDGTVSWTEGLARLDEFVKRVLAEVANA